MASINVKVRVLVNKLIGCLCFGLVLLLPMSAIASADEDLVRKLFEAQKLVSVYQSMLDQYRVQAKQDTQKIMQQMLSQLNPTTEFKERFIKASDTYIKRLLTDRTAEQIVEVLIPYYAEQFTEKELKKLVKFYKSKVGEKSMLVSKNSQAFLLQHYQAENERIRIDATDKFIKELQLIAKECNCEKHKENKK